MTTDDSRREKESVTEPELIGLREKENATSDANSQSEDEQQTPNKEATIETKNPEETVEEKPKSERKYDAILLDIEGTTTPISFVTKVLFPYVTDNLTQYLDEQWTEKETQQDVEALILLSEQDVKDKMEGVVSIPRVDAKPTIDEISQQKAAIVTNVKWQMSFNRKSTALKQLQGHMWRKAYHSGAVKGDIFDDVKPCLQKWVADGFTVCIYSSGSIEAQKLLFGHTKVGDLLPLLTNHFDTTSGPKVVSTSYETIASALNLKPSQIVFLTDIQKEADAAKEAGFGCVCLVVRPENGIYANYSHPKAIDFHEVDKLLTV